MEKKVLNYRIIIEKETYEDGTPVYVSHCPSLGISDYGDTIEQSLNNMQEGIQLAVESLAKSGDDIPVDHVDDQIITTTKIELPSKLKISFT